MSDKIRNILIFGGGLIFLLVMNWMLFNKEQTLKKGTMLYFELAPVDPRSLMQGDYMQLNYKISRSVEVEKISKRGECWLRLDKLGIADTVVFSSAKAPFLKMKYYHNDFSFCFGAETYFFEEGSAEKFANAKYGALMLDEEGNTLLIGLCDENLKLIK